MTRLKLPLQAAGFSLCGLGLTLIWWTTGHSRFWPAWFWLSALLILSVEYVSVLAAQSSTRRLRWFRAHAGLSVVTDLLLLAIWGLTKHHHFWPIYPMVGLGFVLATHALWTFSDQIVGGSTRELSERVDELTRSRKGALDVQDAQLRRIERDLHDGAQARLVALTMQLGRAEEQTRRAAEAGESPPDLSPLLGDARAEAQAAIGELRELARGIAPPLLADRGLVAAVQALAQRSAVEVEVEAALGRRPPAVIENAAYFITAESLTNAAKHAGGAAVKLSMHEHEGSLMLDITDSGPGGADLAGNGLTGLRQRVEALDGVISIHSPSGHGTWIHVELPCEL